MDKASLYNNSAWEVQSNNSACCNSISNFGSSGKVWLTRSVPWPLRVATVNDNYAYRNNINRPRRTYASSKRQFAVMQRYANSACGFLLQQGTSTSAYGRCVVVFWGLSAPSIRHGDGVVLRGLVTLSQMMPKQRSPWLRRGCSCYRLEGLLCVSKRLFGGLALGAPGGP